MTLSEYSRLKDQLKISVVSSERHSHLLLTLKGLFREEINSPRRFESISTIGELLRVLETRDVLSEDNVDPLKKIATQLPDGHDLISNILQYEACQSMHVPRPRGNYYAQPERNQHQFYREPLEPVHSNNPYGHVSDKKKTRILDLVTNEIGKSWRDLARNLELRECTINKIDQNYKPFSRKAAEAINIYWDTKADPDRWFFELCEALEKTRRRDLSKSISKILTSNI